MTGAKRSVLAAVAREVNVLRFLDYRSFLQAVYQKLKEQMERYSYLQFADDLGFSQTNVVHLVIRRKRKLAPKSVERIMDALELKKTERLYFETLVKYAHARTPRKREIYFDRLHQLKAKSLLTSLDQSQMEYYSAWYHPVVRELVAMPGFDEDPDWIAARLTPHITPEQARRSVELLLSLNLIVRDAESGRLRLTQNVVSTGNEIAAMSVARYHQNVIELGRESITSIPARRRDISAVTVCVSEQTAQAMKAEIQAFRKKLLMLADEAGPGGQVFQLNIQFFPFTVEEDTIRKSKSDEESHS